MTHEDDDHVSMHHRIRRSLRRRLKHHAAETERPVTDLVNEAIEIFLASNSPHRPYVTSPLEGLRSAPDRIEVLRQAASDGIFYVTASTLSKADLVTLAQFMGRHATERMSTDRIIAVIQRAL